MSKKKDDEQQEQVQEAAAGPVLLYPNALKGAMRARLATMDYRQNQLFEEMMDMLGGEPFVVAADGSIGEPQPAPAPEEGK